MAVSIRLILRELNDLHSAINLGQVTVGNHLGWLVTDTNLEAGWAPIDELDGTLCLESGNSEVDIIGNNIAAVQQASGHVLSVARIALYHLVVGFEACHGNLLNGVGLVGGLSGRDNRGICNQREVDTGVRDQVSLELVEIDVKRTIESEGGGDRRNN